MKAQIREANTLTMTPAHTDWERLVRSDGAVLITDLSLSIKYRTSVLQAIERTDNWIGRVGRKIGQGGQGSVYKYGQHVVKRLCKPITTTDSYLANIQAALTLAEILESTDTKAAGCEVRAARPLAALLNIGGDSDRALVVTEFITGVPLKEGELRGQLFADTETEIFRAIAESSLPANALNLDNAPSNFIHDPESARITRIDVGANKIFQQIMESV